MHLRLSLVFALCCAGGALPAQARDPVALTLQTSARDGVVRDTVRPSRARGRVAQRYAVSALGAAAGAVAGVWLAFENGTRGCNGPPGFCGIGADYGTAWMTAILIPGAALGAALPRAASTCSFGERLLSASGGALIGGGLGALVGSARDRGTMAWLAFGGSTSAATFSAHRCRTRSPS